jgi:hypothetical protein
MQDHAMFKLPAQWSPKGCYLFRSDDHVRLPAFLAYPKYNMRLPLVAYRRLATEAVGFFAPDAIPVKARFFGILLFSRTVK